MKNVVKTLDETVESLKLTIGAGDKEPKENRIGIKHVITASKSLQEILAKVCEYEHDEINGILKCIICNQSFSCPQDLSQELQKAKQSRK